MKHSIFTFIMILLIAKTNNNCFAQSHVEKIPFGDFDQWVTRIIKESRIMGGDRKTLYEVGPVKTIDGNIPYIQPAQSPWATSNVMANVMGIIKTSNTVYPEKRGNGYCVRMETDLVKCKALGIVNIAVIASGSIFLGEVPEPIRNTSNPQSKLSLGIPFNKKPKALRFDYKVDPATGIIKTSGLSSIEKMAGYDSAEVCLFLQNRWEDKDGNIYAKRIGTAAVKFGKKELEWINGFTLPIYYGDIRKKPEYKSYMNLISSNDPRYSKNKKGEVVPIQEVGWGNAGDAVTHILLRFSAGDKGAYVGAPGSKFWIDNVELIY